MSQSSIRYAPPLTLTFTLLMAAIFALDAAVCKFTLTPALFVCPGRAEGVPGGAIAAVVAPFNFADAPGYLRLFLHVLGNTGWLPLMVNALLLLYLGQPLEESFGSRLLALMVAVAALVTGVLTACLVPAPATGAASTVLLFMLLTITVRAARGQPVPLGHLLAPALYIACLLYDAARAGSPRPAPGGTPVAILVQYGIPAFASLAGAICGSLFGLLSTPAAGKAAPGASRAASAGKKNAKKAPGKKPAAAKRSRPARQDKASAPTVVADAGEPEEPPSA